MNAEHVNMILEVVKNAAECLTALITFSGVLFLALRPKSRETPDDHSHRPPATRKRRRR